MTTGREQQPKSFYQEEISALLISVEKERGWDQSEVERRLGWSKNYISKAKGGHSPINKPLLEGLRLLKVVIELQKQLEAQPPPETLEQKVARLEERLNRLDKFGGRVTYGEHQARHSAMNEKPEKPLVGEKNPPQLPPLTPKPTADVIRRARELGDAPGEGHTQAANE